MAFVRPENWRPDPGVDLQSEKDAMPVVTSDRSVAVVAGPGAGKTELLAQRASYLLLTGTCPPPQRILALCFKVDAVDNLKRRVHTRCGPDLSERFDCSTFHSYAKHFMDRFRLAIPSQRRPAENYELGKLHRPPGNVSFDKMIPIASDILRQVDPIRRALRATYSHVFLDEFQDCTVAQYELVKQMFHGTGAILTAVGDTNQSIMGWAGALEGVFEDFRRDFEAGRRALVLNRRSAPYLQQVQWHVIKAIDPQSVGSLPQGSGGTAQLAKYADSEVEADDVASKIQSLLQQGDARPAIAVLVRAKDVAKRLMRVLRHRGIRHRDETSDLQDVLSEPLSRLIRSWLRLLWEPRDREAWDTVTESLLQSFGLVDDDSTQEARLRDQVHSRLKADRKFVRQQVTDGEQLRRLTSDTLVALLGVERVRATWPQYAQESNLKRVCNRTWDAIWKAREGAETWLEALNEVDGREAVRIMTIHKSKGLEFDAVFLLGLEDEAFFGSDDKEEWCCFLVAISRAKQGLWITRCDRRPELDKPARRWVRFQGFYECLSAAGVSIERMDAAR